MALLEEGIKDTYEVERFFGGGMFADVYRVNHRFLGRQAMKVFKQTNLNVEMRLDNCRIGFGRM